MAMTVVRTLEDGATVVRDDADGWEVALKPGQWDEIARLPFSEQRTRVEQFVIQNRRGGADPRTELEQNAMQANEQGQGERHEQSEEAR